MTDVLDSRQLEMDLVSPTVAPSPMDGAGDKQEPQHDQANFYRVVCNAGAFIVKASDEYRIGYNLEDGIKMPMPHVKQDSNSGDIPTLQSLLGLEEIDHSTVQIEQIVGKLAAYYSANDTQLVTYVANTVSLP